MTRIVVEIDCKGRQCGDCQHVSGWDPDWWCDLFLTAKQTERILYERAGRPQRCAQCLQAEIKEKDNAQNS